MIESAWLTADLEGSIITLTAYPGTRVRARRSVNLAIGTAAFAARERRAA